MKLTVFLLGLPFLMACSIHELKPDTNVARTSMKYNLEVEEAQNEDLLVNIWRAKKRYPLYLTDVSKVSGSLKRDITIGLSIPIGHVTGYQDTLSPSTTLSVNPTFDVNVLNTQDFMRGFLSPVSPGIFAYYWRHGWPPELLLSLMVRQISIYDVNDLKKPLGTIDNYPDPSKPEKIKANLFGQWAHFIQQFKLASCQNPLLNNLKATDFSSIDAATKALSAGLVLEKTPVGIYPADKTSKTTTTKTSKNNAGAEKSQGTNKLTSANETTDTTSEEKSSTEANAGYYDVKTRFDFLYLDPGNQTNSEILDTLNACSPQKYTATKDTTKDNGNSVTTPSQDPKSTATYKGLHLLASPLMESLNSTDLRKPGDEEAVMLALYSDNGAIRIAKLALRSPESVLYYLGELARIEEYHDLIPRVCINRSLQPIFVAYSAETALKDAKAKELRSCKPLLQVEDGEHRKILIPTAHDPDNPKDSTIPKEPCVSEKIQVPGYDQADTTKIGDLPPLEIWQCNSGRSMNSLILLTQLIGLQKAASQFPTTPSVRVIGQ
jgi:hypothetical protein